MKRIQVIGPMSNNMYDFLIQWAMVFSGFEPVALLFENGMSIEPFGENRLGYLSADNLLITTQPDQIGDKNAYVITNRTLIDADVKIVFVEQHLHSWDLLKSTLAIQNPTAAIIVFWDFQISKYDEDYWLKSIISDCAALVNSKTWEFILSDKDKLCWLRAQVEQKMAIKGLSRRHKKQLHMLSRHVQIIAHENHNSPISNNKSPISNNNGPRVNLKGGGND